MRANFGEFLSMFRRSNFSSKTCNHNNERQTNSTITIRTKPSSQGLWLTGLVPSKFWALTFSINSSQGSIFMNSWTQLHYLHYNPTIVVYLELLEGIARMLQATNEHWVSEMVFSPPAQKIHVCIGWLWERRATPGGTETLSPKTAAKERCSGLRRVGKSTCG